MPHILRGDVTLSFDLGHFGPGNIDPENFGPGNFETVNVDAVNFETGVLALNFTEIFGPGRA